MRLRERGTDPWSGKVLYKDTGPEANIHFTNLCFGKGTNNNVSETSAELILNEEAGLSPLACKVIRHLFEARVTAAILTA